MDDTATGFAAWAVVEVMGHNTYAGYVTEEEIAGRMLLRVDVPEKEDRAAYTKYIGPQAIYGITPCDEEVARTVNSRTYTAPLPVQMPRAIASTVDEEFDVGDHF